MIICFRVHRITRLEKCSYLVTSIAVLLISKMALSEREVCLWFNLELKLHHVEEN